MTPACYGHMTALLQPVAPTALLLEGGYNLAATAASVEACVRVLLGEAPARLSSPLIPTRVGLAGINSALAVQARWDIGGGALPWMVVGKLGAGISVAEVLKLAAAFAS